MGDFDLGDFQGVVTLGVARASKCIFPYRGARFSKMGAPSCTRAWVYMAPSVPAWVENGPKTAQRQAEAANVGQN
jgi:hypothetical protein